MLGHILSSLKHIKHFNVEMQTLKNIYTADGDTIFIPCTKWEAITHKKSYELIKLALGLCFTRFSGTLDSDWSALFLTKALR